MSKVVLLAINAKYVHSSLSVWVIAVGVSKYARLQHDINVIEATINQKIPDIVELVTENKPDIIGISSYIWSAGMLPGLLASLRERLPGVVLVLGGPEAENNADFWLEHGADYVLQGEGEYSFPQLLDEIVERELDCPVIAVSEPQSHEDCTNFTRFRVKPAKTNKYDDPVDPYTDAYFEALGGRLSYIETSRGCPFSCAFCLSAGSCVRYFPLDLVKEQILKLSKSNTKTLKFVDRTFNCNTDRANELFEYIIGLDTACCFHFEVAADLFNGRMLSLLGTAPPGRIQFEIGLQSFYKPALKASSRYMDVEKVEYNIRELLQKQNIHIHVDLIAGLPYETLDEFKNSFNRAYSLNAHNLQLGFLKLLHGSKLRNQAESFGIKYSKEPPYEITSSPWLSEEDIQVLKHVENALQQTRNKNRFLSTLDYILSATGERSFSLMHSLGMSVPNHGAQLEDYAVQVYDFFVGLPGVDEDVLKDCMINDWLGMVKGKNTPSFLKNKDGRRKKVAEDAETLLGRKINREEYAVLSSGKGVFVDSKNRSPVTGLYRVCWL